MKISQCRIRISLYFFDHHSYSYRPLPLPGFLRRPSGMSFLCRGSSLFPGKTKALRNRSALYICWHLPIFPGRRQPSIVGTTELNFCVRNGNRWTLCVIDTNFFSGRMTLTLGRMPIENRIRERDSNSFFENLVVQAFGLLVSVSSTHCCASTSDLSNS